MVTSSNCNSAEQPRYVCSWFCSRASCSIYYTIRRQAATMQSAATAFVSAARIQAGRSGCETMQQRTSGFGVVASTLMLQSVEQLADAVTVTMDSTAIEFKDKRKKIVCTSWVKQVANATDDTSGNEGYTSVAAGMNAMGLRRGINVPVDAVVAHLKTRAKLITTTDDITQVGTISANREREIGNLIAWAMEKVGKEGVVTVSLSDYNTQFLIGKK